MTWKIYSINNKHIGTIKHLVGIPDDSPATEIVTDKVLDNIFSAFPKLIGKNFIVEDEEGKTIYLMDDPANAGYSRYGCDDYCSTWKGADEFRNRDEE